MIGPLISVTNHSNQTNKVKPLQIGSFTNDRPLISVTNHNIQSNVHALWPVNEPITSWILLTSAVLSVLRTNGNNGNAPCADHRRVPSVHSFTFKLLFPRNKNCKRVLLPIVSQYQFSLSILINTRDPSRKNYYFRMSWNELMYWS